MAIRLLSSESIDGALTLTGNLTGTNATFTGNLIFNSGTYLTHVSSNYLKLRYASTTNGGIIIYDGDDTVQGYIYADGATNGNSFGLLDGSGSWAVRCKEAAGVELYYSTDNSLKFETTSTGVAVTGNIITTGIVAIGDGTQAINSDAILTLRTTTFAGLDIQSSRAAGNNLGGMRVFHTASTTTPVAQFLVKDNGIYDFYNGTNGAENRMRITSGGQVQVGYYNTARGGANTTFMTGKSGTTYLELNGGDTSGEGGLLFADGSGGNYGLINYSHVSDIMQFYTASAQRMRIDSGGSVIIGDGATSGTPAGDYRSLEIGRQGNTITGAPWKSNLYFSTNATITAGSTAFTYRYASELPTNMIMEDGFWTFSNAVAGTVGSTISFTERMKIAADGFGYFYNNFYLASASNQGNLFFGTADNQYNIFGGGTYGYMGYNTGGYHRFLVNGSNRLQLEDGEMKVYSTAGLQVLRLTPNYIQTGRIPIRYPYYRTDSFKSDGSGYFWAFGHEKSDGTQSINMLLNDGASGNKTTRIINNLHICSFASNEVNGAYPTFTTNVVLRNSGDSYFNGGNVGIGTTSPPSKLSLEGAFPGAGFGININNTGASGAAEVYFENDAQRTTIGLNTGDNFVVYDNTSATTRMQITPAGQIQFPRTGQPPITNSLYGNIVLDSNAVTNFQRIRYDVGTTPYWGLTRLNTGNFAITGGSTWNDHALEIDYTTQNVFIDQKLAVGQTTAPGRMLEVNGGTTNDGGIKLTCSANLSNFWSGIEFRSSVATSFIYMASNDADGTLQFLPDASLKATLSKAGTWTVAADVVAYGSPSDKRLKENIKPIQSALDKVSKLQGVTFDWIQKEDQILDIKEDIGFIAQDVQKVIPELVRENDNGMLSMRHQGIAPILLEAIKELKAEIEELKLNNCNCNK